MTKTQVGIVMGSESDLESMKEAGLVLDDFGIGYEMRILSAHRTPALASEYARTASARGLKIIIAGAGMANHLAGAMAAHTVIPVIGVPLDSSSVKGLDALFSTVQMPPGIPVACMAIGKSGAKNAGFLAAQIIGLSMPQVAKKLEAARRENEEKIVGLNKELSGR